MSGRRRRSCLGTNTAALQSLRGPAWPACLSTLHSALQSTLQEEVKPKKASMGAAQMAERAADAAGISLGPIGLTIGSDLASTSRDEGDGSSDEASSRPQSIASLTTDEWRELYEREGRVDLWVKEEFNSGSRLVVSAACGQASARQQ